MKAIKKKNFWKDYKYWKAKMKNNIQDQGEKQLNAIEKQGDNWLRIIQKDDKIVYLREKI